MTMTPPEYLGVHARLIGLLNARAEMLAREDRYAALLSQCRTSEAVDLTRQVFGEVAQWQRASVKRVRKLRAKSGRAYHDAVERFVGDLLRARSGENASGRVYHALGKTDFEDDPVNYDVFMGMLKGLKGLWFVGHQKGRTRYQQTSFGRHAVTLPGRASRFWATEKLVTLAAHYGIHKDNIGEHFTLEPPTNPLVLRDYAVGKGVNKERGRIIKDYQRTKHTERLAADIRELNEFLDRCEITGGEHHGYTRNFNNASWDKGGRLYSLGGGYQLMPEQRRWQMTINGEAVAEIDIKASFLTIYHAKLGDPLSRSEDPYVRAGVARDVAKLWMVASFGNSKPSKQWPPKMAKDYKKETGLDLRKVAKAKDVAEKMLAAFPALERLESFSDIWADLQFVEAEAIFNTMLILMRSHSVPTLSMHDGILVPKSRVELTKGILAKQFQKFVGVAPVLTTETGIDATEL